MDECEGDFGDTASPTDRCAECNERLCDHYWYAGLFERK